MIRSGCPELNIEVPDGVYAPSEDSDLLLEAVGYARGDVLDLCAGSGIVGLSAAGRARKVTLADVSDAALETIKANAARNGIENVETVKSNLFAGLAGRKFDVIYCNPPYLPGRAEMGNWLDAATVGGEIGYETTIEAIRELHNGLKTGGEAFFILSTAYDIEKVYKEISSLKFSLKKIRSVRFFFEELVLVEIKSV